MPTKTASPRKATAKKATTQRTGKRRITAAGRAAMARNAANARAARAAKLAGKPSPPKLPKEQTERGEAMSRARAVRRYLEWVRDGGGEAVTVSPESIDALEADVVAETDVMKKLKKLKRLRELKQAASSTGVHDEFVRIGKQWATDTDTRYADLRELGVPAATLKEAGIER